MLKKRSSKILDLAEVKGVVGGVHEIHFENILKETADFIISTGEAMISITLSSPTEGTYAVDLVLDTWEP